MYDAILEYAASQPPLKAVVVAVHQSISKVARRIKANIWIFNLIFMRMTCSIRARKPPAGPTSTAGPGSARLTAAVVGQHSGAMLWHSMHMVSHFHKQQEQDQEQGQGQGRRWLYPYRLSSLRHCREYQEKQKTRTGSIGRVDRALDGVSLTSLEGLPACLPTCERSFLLRA